MDTASSTEPIALATRPARSLWRNADYLILWAGQSVSILGSEASQLALPLLILATTGSAAQAGLLGALRGLAYILFGLPAGVLVDRWRRKRVMVLCDLGRTLAFASIPLALLAGRLSAVQLYGVSFVEGVLFIFFGIAETACLTRVVTSAQLPTAIAQSQASDATASLVGPPLGGVLFGIARALPFVADAVSYALSVLSILCIRTRLQDDRSEAHRPLRSEIGEGLRWIGRQPVLHVIFWLNCGVNIVFGGWTLVVIELAQRQGASSGAIGLIFACGGAGTILGALLAPLIQRRLSIGVIVIGVAWMFAITWPPYAFAPNLFVLGAINTVGFFFVPITSGTQFSYRLLLVPDALQGRVNSVFRLGSFGGQALSFLLAGVLLQWYGPLATVWITFVPALALAVLVTLSASLRRAGRLAAVRTTA